MLRLLRALLVLFVLPSISSAQSSGAAPSAGGGFRAVRSVAGSEGVQQAGRFVITAPRSVFHVPADKKVLVYFEWDGPLGEHQFEGYWKNPDGKVVIISDFKYTARERRFGGYWQLDLMPSIAPGIWTLEARIDGQVAGSHSFQIVQSEQPVAAPTRRMLQTAEQYKRLLASTVQFQRLDAAARPSGSGRGVVLDKDLVLTAFQVIDGASKLRLRFPDGRQVEDPTIAWWDRMRDLAIVRADTGATPKLERAATGAWAVGDHVYALDVANEGGAVIKEESIFGLNDHPTRGPRINITDLHTPTSAGGAVVNDYGEMIGILGGALFPGMVVLPNNNRNVQGLNQASQGSLATPISVLPEPVPAAGKTLAELAQSGQFVPPLVPNDELLYGGLGEEVKPAKNSPFGGTRQMKNEFSRSQSKIGVQLSWSPRAKLKGTLLMRIYNIQNAKLFESKPLALKLSPGQMAASTWNLDVASLPAGTYRVDVFLNDVPVWRAFMNVTE